jgi:anti-anti-sigma regulatory factor
MECATPPTFGRAAVLVADGRQPRQLRSRVIEALEEGGRHVIIDCDEWRALDVVMLSALVHSASACRARGATFELQNLSREMRSHIEALRLQERLCLRD